MHTKLLGPCFKTGQVNKTKRWKVCFHPFRQFRTSCLCKTEVLQAHASEIGAQSIKDWKSKIVMCFVHPLTSRRFQFCLTLFPEYFAMFPHGTSLLSNTSEIFSFWWKLPPLVTLISKSETLIQSTKRGARWQFRTFTQICVFFQMTLHLNDRWHNVQTLQLNGKPLIYIMSFSLFARRYWGNPCLFLFLRLMICLSSAGTS